MSCQYQWILFNRIWKIGITIALITLAGNSKRFCMFPVYADSEHSSTKILTILEDQLREPLVSDFFLSKVKVWNQKYRTTKHRFWVLGLMEILFCLDLALILTFLSKGHLLIVVFLLTWPSFSVYIDTTKKQDTTLLCLAFFNSKKTLRPLHCCPPTNTQWARNYKPYQ